MMLANQHIITEGQCASNETDRSESVKATVATRISDVRRDCGLTQTDFAAKIKEITERWKTEGLVTRAVDISINIVSNWENGQRKPSPEALLAIAEIGNTTADWLLCAPWCESEARPGENGKPMYFNQEVDIIARQIDDLDPGLRRMVVRNIPSLIIAATAQWQSLIDEAAEVRQQLVNEFGEQWVRDFEKRKEKRLKK